MASIIFNRMKAPDMFVVSLSLPRAVHHSLYIDAKPRRVTAFIPKHLAKMRHKSHILTFW
jgi:hypothetical protein